MYSWRIFTAVLALTAATVVIGCGNEGDPAPQPTAEPEATEATEETAQQNESEVIPEAMQAFEDDGNVAEITIEGNDLMQFDTNRFTVAPGQMVRLTLKHVGQLPAQAMGHNVVVLNADEDIYEFGADVGEAGGGLHNEYVPQELRDRVIAFTTMIGGGETTTVEFRAPTEPNDYPYLCSFPGHFGQMNGIMAVEE
ncbi:MAG: plastocyanin/azurin family copper-binding protein [Phycisphaeraceae bacterium]